MAASRTPDWDSLLLQSHDLVRAVSERQPSGCLAQLSHGWVNTLTGRDGAIWLQPGLLQSLRARLPLPPPKAPATPTPPSPPSLQDQPLPRVQRDILQVEQYSQKLRSRAAGGDATADTLEASRLLASEGLNPRKLTRALQTFELRPTYEDVFQVETATVEEYLQQVGARGQRKGRWLCVPASAEGMSADCGSLSHRWQLTLLLLETHKLFTSLCPELRCCAHTRARRCTR